MKLFEKIKQMKSRFQLLTTELQESFSGVSEQQRNDLLNEAVKDARKK